MKLTFGAMGLCRPKSAWGEPRRNPVPATSRPPSRGLSLRRRSSTKDRFQASYRRLASARSGPERQVAPRAYSSHQRAVEGCFHTTRLSACSAQLGPLLTFEHHKAQSLDSGPRAL
jgi:hypothetical protein